MLRCDRDGTSLVVHTHLTTRIDPWGPDTVRVRSRRRPRPIIDEPGALVERPVVDEAAVAIEIASDGAELRHGTLAVAVDARGFLSFRRADTGAPLLRERVPFGRQLHTVAGEVERATVRFEAHDGERFYGLGQHHHGFLDQKGCVIPLRHREMELAVPLAVSSRGYGFLWNDPAIGEVQLARNVTQWSATQTRQIDYLVSAGGYAEVLRRYAIATGFPPPMPSWALGFWQSKLRYRTQDELLAVAREYRRRGLPLDVIVIDYYHWPRMGDWCFDPADWPDPAAMVRELDELGVRVLVSVWPTVNHKSRNAAEMRARGLLVDAIAGEPVHRSSFDKPDEVREYMHYYDPTNPEARGFVWDRVREGYHRHGIRMFWLDACEPQLAYDNHENMRFHVGTGPEVACRYPLDHQRTFFDGLRAEGETEIVNLCRAAWAGSQRYAALIWSGDIDSTWDALRRSIPAGLNMAMSGIPWWNTDIGGFRHGDPEDPGFRELVVRWFQYATFTPVTRLHGMRQPSGGAFSGGPNEVWSFGEEAYAVIVRYLRLRERLRPYLTRQMDLAHETGLPPMRPLVVDFPDDPDVADLADQFLCGADLLVAPVLEPGVVERRVRLPRGAEWTDAWTGERHAGGAEIAVAAPLERIPLLLRDDAELPIVEER